MIAACGDHIPAERMEAQVKLLKETCGTCLKVSNACDARICADRARRDFGETPKGWGDTAEAGTWDANDKSISKCMFDIIDATGRWKEAEELKQLRHQDYDKRIQTGCE